MARPQSNISNIELAAILTSVFLQKSGCRKTNLQNLFNRRKIFHPAPFPAQNLLKILRCRTDTVCQLPLRHIKINQSCVNLLAHRCHFPSHTPISPLFFPIQQTNLPTPVQASPHPLPDAGVPSRDSPCSHPVSSRRPVDLA